MAENKLVLIYIGGIEMPPPVSYKVTLSDLDAPNSGRSESGVMNRDRVRADVGKIELSWKNLTTTQLKTIVQAVSPEEFEVRYFFGTEHTAIMYAGDRSIDLKVPDEPESYWDMSVNLIEY